MKSKITFYILVLGILSFIPAAFSQLQPSPPSASPTVDFSNPLWAVASPAAVADPSQPNTAAAAAPAPTDPSQPPSASTPAATSPNPLQPGAPAPAASPWEFNIAPCPKMMANFAEGLALCDRAKDKQIHTGLTQADANSILYNVAVCQCGNVYSAYRPNVQVALGRCRDWFPVPDEREVMIKRVSQCIDGDYAQMAIDSGMSIQVDGKNLTYNDPNFNPNATVGEAPRIPLSGTYTGNQGGAPTTHVIGTSVVLLATVFGLMVAM
ncbi:hypothetical protein HDV00_009973 [Rhizophlyctis rosea]|nr:hypothetical protein HDV00_009973 [Rhizophlyctis rosea]